MLAAYCRDRDANAVSAWISERHGVDVEPARVVRWFREADAKFSETDSLPLGESGPWSDGSWSIWIGNRLLEDGELRASATRDTEDFYVNATLHVFFVFLEETEAMLQRLMKDDTYRQHLAQVARSKMFTTTLFPQPIDSVAASVAPLPNSRTEA